MNGNRSKSAFFEGGWVTLSADFRGKGASPTNHCWCQKTRVIAVLCGIKIFAVRCLILSQYTHLSDGETDGQNCDSNTVRCITCSRTVKMYANVMYLHLLAPQRCMHWRACWSCDVDAFLVWFETHQDIECHDQQLQVQPSCKTKMTLAVTNLETDAKRPTLRSLSVSHL